MTKESPNVLLICTDHWSGRMGGWAGHSAALTPTIDQMAQGGVAFDNAYSACPVCVPARRTLMTGMTARSHGVRSNKAVPMPDAPKMAQCFRDAGYQSFGVGKLHVTPQRSRIGFDDVLACEEGRHPPEMPDDWEMFLSEKGVGGRQYAGGGTQNDYMVTPWHLADDFHPTNWTAREMARVIQRRERGRPSFWFMSFITPHPPLWPLASYLEQYQKFAVPQPVRGSWLSGMMDSLPPVVRSKIQGFATSGASPEYIALVRRAFYAMATQIDHQIRTVLGTIREEGLANNTIVAFTSDHGDMLGEHDMWGKCLFYEDSTRIPFVINAPRDVDLGRRGRVDHRLVELADVMPTLLDLCGLPVPDSVEGRSVFSDPPRDEIYGEFGDDAESTRMIRHGRFKLIYYPAGNIFQLFDVEKDPGETTDLIQKPEFADEARILRQRLGEHLYGNDRAWFEGEEWKGLPSAPPKNSPGIGCSGQRGYRF